MHHLDRGRAPGALTTPAPPPRRAAPRARPRCPWLTSPGASTSTNGTSAPSRFLSRAIASSTASGSTPSSRTGRPLRGEQLAHLRAQLVAARRGAAPRAARGRPPRRGGSARSRSPSRSRGRPCARGSAPGGARRRARRRRRPRASCARRRRSISVVHLGAAGDALPQLAAGDQRRLQHLDPAGRELLGGQRAQRERVDEHARPAGGRRRRSSWPRAGRARSCRRRPSRPARRAWSAPARPGTPRW